MTTGPLMFDRGLPEKRQRFRVRTWTPPTLGTDLRRLVTTLDGSVDHAYEADGLAFRAAFTPVTRVLLRHLSLPVGDLARETGDAFGHQPDRRPDAPTRLPRPGRQQGRSGTAGGAEPDPVCHAPLALDHALTHLRGHR